MNAAIPPEFERFARERVAAGRYAAVPSRHGPAVTQASRDTRLPIDHFPAQPPFTLEEVLAEVS